MNEAKRRARILVVDDEERNRRLLVAMLEADGYRVMHAYGGAEAIKVARSARPVLVILDLMMPKVSGYEGGRARCANRSQRRAFRYWCLPRRI